MKLFHISLLLFSALLLNGCIGEDMTNCPPFVSNNISIKFLYPDDDGKDIFSKKINKVDLFVFDTDGRYVTSQCIEQDALSVFAGAHLKLDPGTYRFVLWGNVDDKCEFSGTTNGNLFADAFLGNSTINENSVAINGDKLYYAPNQTAGRSLPRGFVVDIPEQGVKTTSVNFKRAHIRVVAYVKGFEDYSPQGKSLTPLVELTNIPSKYDFDMQTCGNQITYSSISTLTTINGEEMAVMDFNTPLFKEDTPMEIIVKKQSDGIALTTVSLAEFIRDNNITIGNTVDLVLPIMIEYKQGSFEITLPGWGQTPVGPDI